MQYSLDKPQKHALIIINIYIYQRVKQLEIILKRKNIYSKDF